MSEVQGRWTDRWQRLVNAIQENMAEAGEEAAALAVYRAGEPLVSLWAGEASPGQSWQEDTQVNLFSASKGIVALSILQLVDARQLDLEKATAIDRQVQRLFGYLQVALGKLLGGSHYPHTGTQLKA